MFAALDVHYKDTCATTACVAFASWRAAAPDSALVVTTPSAAAYEPGAFFRRELPCLRAAVATAADDFEILVIDGYVWLGPDRPGLGWHLFEALQHETAIIGVAKNAFADCQTAQTVYRGRSRKPLYVTAEGIEPQVAAQHIADMHGAYRIPTLLKHADQLARSSTAQNHGDRR